MSLFTKGISGPNFSFILYTHTKLDLMGAVCTLSSPYTTTNRLWQKKSPYKRVEVAATIYSLWAVITNFELVILW